MIRTFWILRLRSSRVFLFSFVCYTFHHRVKMIPFYSSGRSHSIKLFLQLNRFSIRSFVHHHLFLLLNKNWYNKNAQLWTNVCICCVWQRATTLVANMKRPNIAYNKRHKQNRTFLFKSVDDFLYSSTVYPASDWYLLAFHRYYERCDTL